MRIAGKLNTKDWHDCRKVLTGSPGREDWERAYKNFFYQRLNTRYLAPIRLLMKEFAKSRTGEGFAIVTLQCCLIEFLESTAQGKSYRHGDTYDATTEYNSSEKIFKDFLCTRAPFKNEFSRTLAGKFYSAVRCGLVHEAATKSPWTISSKTRTLKGQIVDKVEKILYRNNFQLGLERYIEDYGKRLLDDPKLQEGMIRKFDHICE